jgi:hypothetical protein
MCTLKGVNKLLGKLLYKGIKRVYNVYISTQEGVVIVSKDTQTITIRVDGEIKKRLAEIVETGENDSVSALVNRIIISYLKWLDKKPEVPEHLHTTGISNATTPIYDPTVHKPGDKVLRRVGKKLVPCIVPRLDASGNPIPDEG